MRVRHGHPAIEHLPQPFRPADGVLRHPRLPRELVVAVVDQEPPGVIEDVEIAVLRDEHSPRRGELGFLTGDLPRVKLHDRQLDVSFGRSEASANRGKTTASNNDNVPRLCEPCRRDVRVAARGSPIPRFSQCLLDGTILHDPPHLHHDHPVGMPRINQLVRSKDRATSRGTHTSP